MMQFFTKGRQVRFQLKQTFIQMENSDRGEKGEQKRGQLMIDQ